MADDALCRPPASKAPVERSAAGRVDWGRPMRVRNAPVWSRPAADADLAGSGPGAGPDAVSVWVRMMPAWHVAFAVLLTLVIASMYLVGPPAAATKADLVFVALGGAYAIWGVRGGRTRAPRDRWTFIVLAGAAALLATWAVPAAAVSLFVLYPMCWLLSDRPRDGVVATCLLSFGVGTGTVLAGPVDANLWESLIPQLVLGAAFSIALGFFVIRLIDQSRDRMVLIDQLTAAQAELATAHHSAGVVAERERLAAEIHDTLAQGFTSIAMQAEAALASPGVDHESADRLRLIARTARDNLAEARALVAAFSPAGLERGTLVEAVRRVAGRFQDETGTRVRIDVTGEGADLSRDREVVLLRAVQEALANVRKHACASNVSLTLVLDRSDVTVEVHDDGVGMASGAPAGFGLAAMSSRVRDVGGSVALSSDPGTGTRVRVAIPSTGDEG